MSTKIILLLCYYYKDVFPSRNQSFDRTEYLQNCKTLICNAVFLGSTKDHVWENLKIILTIRQCYKQSWKPQLRKILKKQLYNLYSPFFWIWFNWLKSAESLHSDRLLLTTYNDKLFSIFTYKSHNASNIVHKYIYIYIYIYIYHIYIYYTNIYITKRLWV